MFEHNGIKYPYFLANQTGNIGTPLVHPTTKQQIAVLGADFAWEDSEPFVRHLNLNLRDERNVRDDESVRRRANVVAQNSRLFADTVQRGWLIEVDEDGSKSEPKEKTREEMLAYPPEIQSQIMDDWLGQFHVERFFPEGQSSVDAMLSTPDKLYFTAKIGNFKNPTHILLFGVNVPNPDQRRAYENDTFQAGSKQEGDKQISTYSIDQAAKIRFSKKHMDTVDGAVLGKNGALDPDEAEIRVIDPSSIEDMKAFKKAFNPEWHIRLADAIADCFNFSGK